MRNRTTIAALLAGLTLGFAAQAAEPAAQADTNAYYNGVTVAIDPATGRLRQPTNAEIVALRASVQKNVVARGTASSMPRTEADAVKTIRKLADGSVIATVPESLMSNVVAVKQADGSIKIQHVGADGAIVEDVTHAEVSK